MIYHTIQKITLVLLGILGSLANMQAADIHSAHWQITLNSNRSFTFTFDGKTLLKNAYARAISGENDELLSIDYPTVTQREETVNDAFGTGTKYVYTFSGRPGKPDMEQTFYLYTAHNYLLTELSLVASTGIVRSHLLSPLTTTSPLAFLPTQGDNRVLTVPFDNDKFRTYNAMKWSLLSIGATSSEVTAFYNIATREALAAMALVRAELPEIKLRFINILSLTHNYIGTTEHQMTPEIFDKLFTVHTPIIANFHGYKDTLKNILRNYTTTKIFAHGFEEKGSTTTPLQMLTLNHASRFDLAIDVFNQLNRQDLVLKYQRLIDENRAYAQAHGIDSIEL